MLNKTYNLKRVITIMLTTTLLLFTGCSKNNNIKPPTLKSGSVTNAEMEEYNAKLAAYKTGVKQDQNSTGVDYLTKGWGDALDVVLLTTSFR